MIEIYKMTNDLVAALKTVTTNIFPMLAPQGTTLPFITYSHSGFERQGSKDGEYGLTITFNLNIVTVDYSSGLQYVDAVRQALNKMTSAYNYSYENTVIGASEEAFDDGYVQTLAVQIEASR